MFHKSIKYIIFLRKIKISQNDPGGNFLLGHSVSLISGTSPDFILDELTYYWTEQR